MPTFALGASATTMKYSGRDDADHRSEPLRRDRDLVDPARLVRLGRLARAAQDPGVLDEERLESRSPPPSTCVSTSMPSTPMNEQATAPSTPRQTSSRCSLKLIGLGPPRGKRPSFRARRAADGWYLARRRSGRQGWRRDAARQREAATQGAATGTSRATDRRAGTLRRRSSRRRCMIRIVTGNSPVSKRVPSSKYPRSLSFASASTNWGNGGASWRACADAGGDDVHRDDLGGVRRHLAGGAEDGPAAERPAVLDHRLVDVGVVRVRPLEILVRVVRSLVLELEDAASGRS